VKKTVLDTENIEVEKLISQDSLVAMFVV